MLYCDSGFRIPGFRVAPSGPGQRTGRVYHNIYVSILFRSQYGFRDKYSTQHAILDIVNTVQSNMDKKLYTCGIFIDLKIQSTTLFC